jgi:uncharacterized glyoxalase superfamily protein PhnB
MSPPDNVIANRSVPASTVIPVLAYQGVAAAVGWLCAAFGCAVRLRIGTHRVQLHLGNGDLVATEGLPSGGDPMATPWATHSLLVRVPQVDAHCARARQHGARIVDAPADRPYGERQYTAVDLGGHCWTFSQSIADVDPADWGGELVEP